MTCIQITENDCTCGINTGLNPLKKRRRRLRKDIWKNRRWGDFEEDSSKNDAKERGLKRESKEGSSESLTRMVSKENLKRRDSKKIKKIMALWKVWKWPWKAIRPQRSEDVCSEKSLKVAPKTNWKRGDNDSERLEFEEGGSERVLRKALRVRRFRWKGRRCIWRNICWCIRWKEEEENADR